MELHQLAGLSPAVIKALSELRAAGVRTLEMGELRIEFGDPGPIAPAPEVKPPADTSPEARARQVADLLFAHESGGRAA